MRNCVFSTVTVECVNSPSSDWRSRRHAEDKVAYSAAWSSQKVDCRTMSSDTDEAAIAAAAHKQLAMIKDELFRKVDEHEERLHQMDEEQKHLAVFKQELMEKVDEHVQAHAKMEEEAKRVAVFKEELMMKVHEHLEDLHKSEDKAAQISKLKEEMEKKINEHLRAVGLRGSF